MSFGEWVGAQAKRIDLLTGTPPSDWSRLVRRRLLTMVARSLAQGGKLTPAERRSFFAVAQPYTSFLGVDGAAGRFIVSTSDVGVGREVFVTGAFDEAEMDAGIRLLRQHTGRTLEGRLFVDIGANIGTSTITAIRRYGATGGIAFEAMPDTLRVLAANLALNDLVSQVDVRPVALSDKAGRLIFELSHIPGEGENWGDRRAQVEPTPGALGEETWATAEVQSSRLDDQHVDWADVGVVWMDVQGHEAHVLAGASTLLSSGVPILTEYWPYGLRRAGGLDRFHAVVAERFRLVVDVRTGQTLSPDRTGDLARQYEGPASFSDLLLVP